MKKAGRYQDTIKALQLPQEVETFTEDLQGGA